MKRRPLCQAPASTVLPNRTVPTPEPSARRTSSYRRTMPSRAERDAKRLGERAHDRQSLAEPRRVVAPYDPSPSSATLDDELLLGDVAAHPHLAGLGCGGVGVNDRIGNRLRNGKCDVVQQLEGHPRRLGERGHAGTQLTHRARHGRQRPAGLLIDRSDHRVRAACHGRRVTRASSGQPTLRLIARPADRRLSTAPTGARAPAGGATRRGRPLAVRRNSVIPGS